MKNYACSIVVVVLAFLNNSKAFAQRNPIGESAHYELDRDRSRTSSSIRSGEATASVNERVDNNAFKVNLNYHIRTTIMGTKEGDSPADFPEQFFSEQFLIDLRVNKHYEDEKLKVDYLGSGDAWTMNGAHYEKCDYIRIYDIKDSGDVEDLEIEAAIKYGVPVIGAVKIDLSGRVSGIRMRAGLDYDP